MCPCAFFLCAMREVCALKRSQREIVAAFPGRPLVKVTRSHRPRTSFTWCLLVALQQKHKRKHSSRTTGAHRRETRRAFSTLSGACSAWPQTRRQRKGKSTPVRRAGSRAMLWTGKKEEGGASGQPKHERRASQSLAHASSHAAARSPSHLGLAALHLEDARARHSPYRLGPG